MDNGTALNDTMAQASLNATGGNVDNLDLNNETMIGDIMLNKQDDSDAFEWTAITVAQAVVLFFDTIGSMKSRTNFSENGCGFLIGNGVLLIGLLCLNWWFVKSFFSMSV